jgi:hypothetical protein
LTVEPRVVDPHCFDADPEPDPDPAKNLDADPDPDPGGGGRSAKNVHPPWQNPRYAPVYLMEPPCFSLKIRLLFIDFFFGSGSETFISVPDRIRIRPKVSDPSGSGSATLHQYPSHQSILGSYPSNTYWKIIIFCLLLVTV